MAVRRLLKQETVLTIIMITVTTILIIGATVAWFLGNKPVTIKNYFQQAGGIDGIEVKMAIVPEDAETDGEFGNGDSGESGTQDPNLEKVGDITYYTMNAINDNSKEIDIDLAKLTNIEEGKLGPGSYGTIKFQISTTSETGMNYIIRITPSIKVVDGVSETGEDGSINKAMLLDLVQNHIKFYAIKDTENTENTPTNVYQKVIPYYFETSSENSSGVASNDISNNTSNESFGDASVTNDTSEAKAIEKTGLTGTVSASNNESEQYVTIYWYWPYEYTDIPGYNIESYNSPIYNPWSVVEDIVTYENKYSSSLSEAERIESYDWDDTKIGNYVTALNFHFEVSAYQ